MDTITVLAGGIALLIVLTLLGRWVGGHGRGIAKGARFFMLIWFVLSAVNFWYATNRMGDTVANELRIFALVFGVPALLALLVWWKFDPTR